MKPLLSTLAFLFLIPVASLCQNDLGVTVVIGATYYDTSYAPAKFYSNFRLDSTGTLGLRIPYYKDYSIDTKLNGISKEKLISLLGKPASIDNFISKYDSLSYMVMGYYLGTEVTEKKENGQEEGANYWLYFYIHDNKLSKIDHAANQYVKGGPKIY